MASLLKELRGPRGYRKPGAQMTQGPELEPKRRVQKEKRGQRATEFRSGVPKWAPGMNELKLHIEKAYRIRCSTLQVEPYVASYRLKPFRADCLKKRR